MFLCAEEKAVKRLNLLVEAGGTQRKLGDKRFLQRAADRGRESFLSHCRFGKVTGIAHDRRQNVFACHVEHGDRLNVDGLAVIFKGNLVAGEDLGFRKNPVLGKEGDALLADKSRQRLGSALEIQEPALGGLRLPGAGVAVPVEDNPLVFTHRLFDQVVEGLGEVGSALQKIGKLREFLGDDGVEDKVRPRDREGRAGHPKFKLVSGEGKRGGPVAVGQVLGEARQYVDPDGHILGHAAVVRLAGCNRIEDAGELVAQEHREDGGRRFVRAEAVVVAGGGNRNPQQVLIIIDSLDDGGEEQQELGIFLWGFAGFEKIQAGVGRKGPVVVLARTIDAGERLLVQQAYHVVPQRNLLHQLHRKLVVIGRGVDGRKDRGQLVLGGGDLLVFGFGEDAELPKLFVEVFHVGGHSRIDRTEVVVIHLLPLG